MRAGHLLPILAFIAQIPASHTPNDFVAKLICGYGAMGILIHTRQNDPTTDTSRKHMLPILNQFLGIYIRYVGFPIVWLILLVLGV